MFIFHDHRSVLLYMLLMSGMLLTGCRQKAIVISTDSQKEYSADMQEQSDTEKTERTISVAEDPITPATEASPKIAVFVCGAVMHPGVFYLNEYARVSDALSAAGGFSASADQEWCNLAAMLQDGQRLRFYTKEETAILESDGYAEEGSIYASGHDASASSDKNDGKINLNTADQEELMTLPGIGSARAEAILSFRREHGGFTSIEEIQQISGIKNSVYEQIKNRIII